MIVIRYLIITMYLLISYYIQNDLFPNILHKESKTVMVVLRHKTRTHFFVQVLSYPFPPLYIYTLLSIFREREGYMRGRMGTPEPYHKKVRAFIAIE